MANLDTREKRSSGVLISIPWRGLLPIPDGTVGQADRQHVACFYSGISAGAESAPVRLPKGRLKANPRQYVRRIQVDAQGELIGEAADARRAIEAEHAADQLEAQQTIEQERRQAQWDEEAILLLLAA